MEQEAAQYWKWMKRKHIMKTRVQAPMMMMKPYDSWEEQAFAEDAAGSLGGCIWPPRSYSCSFCRREFRSAQALGGHMNIHRRERARLKQSLSPQNGLDHHYHKNHDDHPNCSPSLIASSSPLSTSRVSASSTLENFSEHTFFSPYSKSSSLYLCTQYYSNSENYTKKDGFLGMGHVDCIDTDLSMGLNLVVRHNQPTDSDEDEMISCKKPFLSRSSMEELDLELRLGDPQKVK